RRLPEQGACRGPAVARGRASAISAELVDQVASLIKSVSGRFRYTFILALAAFGTCLAALGGWRYARASAPVNGPIVLVSIDSLRADHLPTYGYQHVATPAIDTLARDGVVFERAYVHVPQTLPSHAALLTGRLPFETGLRDSSGYVQKPSERQLPAMLRDRGYATAGIVSSYLL